MKSLSRLAFIHASGVVAYVSVLILGVHFGDKFISKDPGLLGPAVFLLVFVVSAAVTGSLVFGRPVLWYVEGRKQDAMRLALTTVLWLAGYAAIGASIIVFR
ncbi:MAG TPA: hypothetical protein VD862_04120 [Candidatus Paceibacterota bacterium]|nr:hypothetical protein [Candidatus Paceibacterota bacterium]